MRKSLGELAFEGMKSVDFSRPLHPEVAIRLARLLLRTVNTDQNL